MSITITRFVDTLDDIGLNSVTVTATTYTVPAHISKIRADCTSNAINITLPDMATMADNKILFIKKVDSTANAVTITQGGG